MTRVIALVGGRGDGFTRLARILIRALKHQGLRVETLLMPQSNGGVGRKWVTAYRWGDADVIVATTDRCSQADAALVVSRFGAATHAPRAVYDASHPSFAGFEPPDGWLGLDCRRIARERRAPAMHGLILLGALCRRERLCPPDALKRALIEEEGRLGALAFRAVQAGWEAVD